MMQVLTFMAILGMSFVPAISASETLESATSAPSSAPAVIGDILMEDFEEKKRDWKFEGSSFQGYGGGDYWRPGRGDHGPIRLVGYRGQKALKSWGPHGRDIDKQTGLATSTPFKLERKLLRFLLSGGHYPGRVCVNLVVDGKVLASATGQNSHILERVAFDLSAHQGKEAHLEVVDKVTGPWGHVCIDMVYQVDEASNARIVRDALPRGQDLLWTREGLLEGRLEWNDDGALVLDGEPILFESVKSIFLDRAPAGSPTQQAIRLRTGEFWLVDLRSLKKDGKFEINSPHFGGRSVDKEVVTSLEFAPNLDPSKANRPGILYRTNGRPLPGKLVWLKHDNIALDSPLGIIPMPRKELHRYILPEAVDEPDLSLDEVGMVDGTIYRGTVGFADGKVQILHPILETLQLDWKEIRYISRSGNGISWLADLERTSVKSIGPLGPKPFFDQSNARDEDSRFLSTLRVTPQTTLRYKLNGSSGIREFRGVLSPIPGCRGDATVIIAASGKEFYRQSLSGGEPSRTLRLPVPVGDELELRVEFGKRMAFPCGIDLGDAQIAMLDANKEVQP